MATSAKPQQISIDIPLARYDVKRSEGRNSGAISIHIPLARYDEMPKNVNLRIKDFNPHTARAI